MAHFANLSKSSASMFVIIVFLQEVSTTNSVQLTWDPRSSSATTTTTAPTPWDARLARGSPSASTERPGINTAMFLETGPPYCNVSMLGEMLPECQTRLVQRNEHSENAIKRSGQATYFLSERAID